MAKRAFSAVEIRIAWLQFPSSSVFHGALGVDWIVLQLTVAVSCLVERTVIRLSSWQVPDAGSC